MIPEGWGTLEVTAVGALVVATVLSVSAVFIAYKQSRRQQRLEDDLPSPEEVRLRMKLGTDPHSKIHCPDQHGRKGVFDRLSPLFYEETKDGMWKASLGRVAFWFTLFAFLGMCVSVSYSLREEQQVAGNLVTLYISVITMLFLTNLGLLAYNLGSKFTEPTKSFIKLWGKRNGNGAAPTPNPEPEEVSPDAPTEMFYGHDVEEFDPSAD